MRQGNVAQKTTAVNSDISFIWSTANTSTVVNSNSSLGVKIGPKIPAVVNSDNWSGGISKV